MAPRVRRMPHIPTLPEPVLVPDAPPAPVSPVAHVVPQRVAPLSRDQAVAVIGMSEVGEMYEQAAQRAASAIEIANHVRNAFQPGEMQDTQYESQVQAYLNEILQIAGRAGQEIVSLATNRPQ